MAPTLLGLLLCQDLDTGLLLELLKDSSPEVRDQATVGLAALGPRTMARVRERLADPSTDPDVRLRLERVVRTIELEAEAPACFPAAWRALLPPLEAGDWPAVEQELAELLRGEGADATRGILHDAIPPDRRAAIEWVLAVPLTRPFPGRMKARAAAALVRAGRGEALRPHADRIAGWIAPADDGDIPVLLEMMQRFNVAPSGADWIWVLRDHPRLLIQINAPALLAAAPEAAEVLVRLLRRPDAETREAAAHLLAQGRVYDAAPDVAALVKALAPEASPVLIDAAATLNAVEAVPAILRILREGPARLADDAGEALIALGAEDAADALIDMLPGAAPHTAIEAIRVLRVAEARRAAPVIAPLALKGCSPLRLTAVQALQALDPEGWRGTVETALGELAADGYAPAIRYRLHLREVAAVSESPGGTQRVAFPTDAAFDAEAAMRDPSPEVRRLAMAFLREADDGLEILLRGLGDRDAGVRLSAADALTARGRQEGPAELARILGEEPSSLWILAASVAAERGRVELRPLLGTRLQESRRTCAPAIRTALMRALGELTAPGQGDALAAFLDDPDWDVRSEAALAMGRRGGPGVGAALAPFLAHRHDRLRQAAAEALSRVSAPEAIRRAGPHLFGSFPFEREAAVLALRGHRDPVAQDLVAGMADDPSARVRSALPEALRRPDTGRIPVIERTGPDGRREVLTLRTKYGYIIDWPADKDPCFYLFDAPLGRRLMTRDWEVFLRELGGRPDGIEIDAIGKCSASFEWGMPEARRDQLEELLRTKSIRRVDIDDSSRHLSFCYCEGRFRVLHDAGP